MKHQSNTFLTILCVTLWAPQPPAPQSPAPPVHTCILCAVTFLLYILMTWDLFSFQRRDIKLQIDTKFNVLGLVEVLRKCQTHEKKVNHETTPPYLRDQFTTCDHIDILNNIITEGECKQSWLTRFHKYFWSKPYTNLWRKSDIRNKD